MRYIPGFDLLRTVSVCGVVGIHAFHTDPQLSQFSRHLSFAVPCFVLIAIYLSARSLNNGKRYFMWKRIVRMVPAFLAWTVLYVIARWITRGISAPTVYDAVEYVFLGSAALHLYFIPLLIYYSIALVFLPRSTGYRLFLSALGLCIAVSIRYGSIPDIQLGSPEASAFPYYFFYNLPYLFIGIMLFDLTEMEGIADWINERTHILALICGTGAVALWSFPYADPMWIPIQCVLRDTLLFTTFLFLPVVPPRWALALSSVTFGVYLSHHLLLEGLMRLETFAQLVSGEYWVTLTRFAVGFLVTAGACLLLSRGKRTGWLVR